MKARALRSGQSYRVTQPLYGKRGKLLLQVGSVVRAQLQLGSPGGGNPWMDLYILRQSKKVEDTSLGKKRLQFGTGDVVFVPLDFEVSLEEQ